jgi:uncharacterized protein (TIGR03067 family)
MHARRISALNTRTIHDMMNQFRVAPADARLALEQLHDGRLVCPLKGEYRFTAEDDGPPQWTSTAWQRDSVFLEDRVPADYTHAFLDWLRGARMELTLDRTTLSTHVELDVASKPRPADGRALDLAAVSPKSAHVALKPAPVQGGQDALTEPSDLQRFQGTWKVIDDRKSGRRMANTAGACLRFDGDQIVQLSEDVPTYRFRFRLRAELDPNGFDFLPQGRQIWDERGIYRIEGNRIVLCYGGPGTPRPVRFHTQPDDAWRLVILERVDEDASPETAK